MWIVVFLDPTSYQPRAYYGPFVSAALATDYANDNVYADEVFRIVWVVAPAK